MNSKKVPFDINEIELSIQSPNVSLRKELNDYIISQIEKLGKIFSRIERCEVMLHTRKNSQKEFCEVEVKVFVPGKVLFAKEQKVNFRLAAQLAFDDLNHQMIKFKGHLDPTQGKTGSKGLE